MKRLLFQPRGLWKGKKKHSPCSTKHEKKRPNKKSLTCACSTSLQEEKVRREGSNKRSHLLNSSPTLELFTLFSTFITWIILFTRHPLKRSAQLQPPNTSLELPTGIQTPVHDNFCFFHKEGKEKNRKAQLLSLSTTTTTGVQQRLSISSTVDCYTKAVIDFFARLMLLSCHTESFEHDDDISTYRHAVLRRFSGLVSAGAAATTM